MTERTSGFILDRPVVSEKSYVLMQSTKYVFRCHPTAGKVEIAKAIEDLFADQNIRVVAVNTIRVHGKTRKRSRGSRRISGSAPDWKKAIVTIGQGQKINGFFEDV